MKPRTTEIPLARPIIGPNGTPVMRVVVQEPTVAEWIIHDPFTIGSTGGAGGTAFMVNNQEGVLALLRTNIVEPDPLLVLGHRDGALATRLTRVLQDFFLLGDGAPEGSGAGSPTSPTNSSSPDAAASTPRLSIG